MGDIQQAAQQGGRVVIHHLEFDAGLIANELVNAGLEDLMEAWVACGVTSFFTYDELLEAGAFLLSLSWLGNSHGSKTSNSLNKRRI